MVMLFSCAVSAFLQCVYCLFKLLVEKAAKSPLANMSDNSHFHHNLPCFFSFLLISAVFHTSVSTKSSSLCLKCSLKSSCVYWLQTIWLKEEEKKKKKPSAFNIRAFPPNICKYNFPQNSTATLSLHCAIIFGFFYKSLKKKWPARWKAHLHL